MRHLFQPRVLNQSSLAAAVTALACYPRFALWTKRQDSLIFLEMATFVCGAILWGFVFAWHTPYSNQPIFRFKIEPKLFLTATGLGLVTATLFYFVLDPSLRARFPEEYPSDLKHWFALVPFLLSLNLLFLVFAPFDWSLRLLRKPWLAILLTASFAASVTGMKLHSLAEPVSHGLAMSLVLTRFVGGLLAAWLYWRGGLVLVWWWTFLFELRHLLNLEW